MIQKIRSAATLPRIVILLTGLIIAGFIPYHVNSLFPNVGRDYKYFITRMVDTTLHYHLNGLTVQWYTPSFGGGLPAYPHPLNSQFSLAQMLTLLINPWTAILWTYFAYAIVGYIAAYILLRRSLQLHWAASTIGAALFSANGFYLQHLAAGHYNFQAFPLLPVFLALLLSRRTPAPVAAALIGLTSAIVIYSASTYPAVYILLSVLICLPLIYLLQPSAFQWTRFLRIGLLGGLLALAINISKLYAVNSFMRFFPRDMPDQFNVSLPTALSGLGLQLFGVMGLAPLNALFGIKMTAMRDLLQGRTGAYIGLWELDLSLSPVIWLLLLGGAIALLAKTIRQPGSFIPKKMGFWLALGLLLCAIELTIEFTFARGLFYPTLRELPFLRALHVNPRFGVAFLLPLSLLAATVFASWVKHWDETKIWRVFLPTNLLIVLSLGAYLLLPLDSIQQRNYDISGLLAVDQRIKQGETFPIEQIGDVTDQTTLLRQTSNIKPLETLFGYTLKTFAPTVIKGPARDIREDTFNMTDPTGLVYPEIHNATPWSRIPADERAELEDFLAHRQPQSWNPPLGQQITNWVSLAALLICLGLLIYGNFTNKQKRFSSD